MKKIAAILLVILVLLSANALSVAQKEHQSNGKPFNEIWDYLDGLQGQIDSFFDIFEFVHGQDDASGRVDPGMDGVKEGVEGLPGCTQVGIVLFLGRSA